MRTKKIDPTQLFLALTSAFSCLASELSKKGMLDVFDLTTNIEATAATHRQRGNPLMADALHLISEYLLKSVRDPD